MSVEKQKYGIFIEYCAYEAPEKQRLTKRLKSVVPRPTRHM